MTFIHEVLSATKVMKNQVRWGNIENCNEKKNLRNWRPRIASIYLSSVVKAVFVLFSVFALSLPTPEAFAKLSEIHVKRLYKRNTEAIWANFNIMNDGKSQPNVFHLEKIIAQIILKVGLREAAK